MACQWSHYKRGVLGGIMKHLLIDFDSTMPNLALMKISSYYKSKGDDVYLNDDSIEPDEIWLSCIFTWNKQKALDSLNMYKFRFPNATIHYGGTAFDWGRIGNRIQLPESTPKYYGKLKALNIKKGEEL